jgi:hypothetical protein
MDLAVANHCGCLIARLRDVRALLTTVKKIFFWNYARNTWQWDVLCVVCLIFIFLTPKGWVSSGERPQATMHQSPIGTVLLLPEVIMNEADTGQIEQQVRTLPGRSQAEVVAVRKVVGTDGRTVGYEVDIR